MKEDSKKLEPDEFNKKYKDYYEEYHNIYDSQGGSGEDDQKDAFHIWLIDALEDMMKNEKSEN